MARFQTIMVMDEPKFPARRARPLGIGAAVPAQRRAGGDRGVSGPARRVAQVPARAPARADGSAAACTPRAGA